MLIDVKQLRQPLTLPSGVALSNPAVRLEQQEQPALFQVQKVHSLSARQQAAGPSASCKASQQPKLLCKLMACAEGGKACSPTQLSLSVTCRLSLSASCINPVCVCEAAT